MLLFKVNAPFTMYAMSLSLRVKEPLTVYLLLENKIVQLITFGRQISNKAEENITLTVCLVKQIGAQIGNWLIYSQ